jgi:WD40 repeat protein
LPYTANVWGLSPDGKRVMATSKDFTDKVGVARLDFYGITNTGLTRTSSLTPYPDGKNDYNRKVEWAAWITPDRVMTCNQDNIVRLWDMKTGKAVYTMSTGNKNIVLSKDRKAMVVATKSGVALCDTMTGKTLGMVSSEAPFMMRFDFSPDGTRLLGGVNHLPANIADLENISTYYSSAVKIWDLTSGEVIGEFPLDLGFDAPQWVNNRMMMYNQTLYDSESGVPICFYSGFQGKTITFNGLFCYMINSGHGEYILASAKLPHKAALDAADQVKVKEQFVLYPGAEVAVKIETDGSANEKDMRDRLA